LDFGLDPFLEKFVQLLAKVGDGVQAAEMERFDGGAGRCEEMFERTLDGVLSRRRVLACILLCPWHNRDRYHRSYYLL
jgi:hypothetical protein